MRSMVRLPIVTALLLVASAHVSARPKAPRQGLAWLATQVDGLQRPGDHFVIPRGVNKTGLLDLLIQRGHGQGIEYGLHRRRATKELVVMRGDHGMVPDALDPHYAAGLRNLFHVHPHLQNGIANQTPSAGDMSATLSANPRQKSYLLGYPTQAGPRVVRIRVLAPGNDYHAFKARVPSDMAWMALEEARILLARDAGALAVGSKVKVPVVSDLGQALQIHAREDPRAPSFWLQEIRAELGPGWQLPALTRAPVGGPRGVGPALQQWLLRHGR